MTRQNKEGYWKIRIKFLTQILMKNQMLVISKRRSTDRNSWQVTHWTSLFFKPPGTMKHDPPGSPCLPRNIRLIISFIRFNFAFATRSLCPIICPRINIYENSPHQLGVLPPNRIWACLVAGWKLLWTVDFVNGSTPIKSGLVLVLVLAVNCIPREFASQT